MPGSRGSRLQGKLDPVAERAEEADVADTDEQDILRYEERITQLLVTITHLHNKVERLQQRGAREDEEYSDQCSEYTASLPRHAPQPLPPQLPPPREGVGPDMFLALQQVLASLEHTVFARRHCALRLAGAGAETGTGGKEWAQVVETLEELERGLGLSPGLEMAAVQAPGERVAELSPELGAAETSWYGKEAATLAERNMALRATLGSKEQELSRAQVTLQALQEERDRLQRKVKELQDSLYQLETPGQAWSPPGSATTPIREAGSPVGEGDPWLLQVRSWSLFPGLWKTFTPPPPGNLLPSLGPAGHPLPWGHTPATSPSGQTEPQPSGWSLLQLQRGPHGCGQQEVTPVVSPLGYGAAVRAHPEVSGYPPPTNQDVQPPPAAPAPAPALGCTDLPLLAPQDPLARAQSLLQCLKDHPAMQPLCRLLPSAPELSSRELDDQLQQLRGCIERLKGLNHLLAGALQECKSDSERLSMLLGQHESNSTALRLAAQCSEHRMEALEVLLALARAKLDAGGHAPSAAPAEHASQDAAAVLAEARRFLGRAEPDGQEAAGEPGMCGQQSPPSPREEEEEEEEGVLRQYLRQLQAEQAAVEVSLLELGCSGPPGAVTRPSDAIRAKVEKAVQASLAALPGERPWPKLDKTQLLQDLAALQESMADVKTQLHLAEKEKRGLELGTYTLGAQEAAYLLLIEHLQRERDAGSGPASSGSSTSEGSTGSSGAGEAEGWKAAAVAPRSPQDLERMTLELASALDRSKVLQDQAQVLAASLEQLSVASRVQQAQCTGLARDFFQAHSALVLAYRGARRKQEAQLRRLEAQTGAMGERQAQQAHALAQRIRALEEQRAAGAETCI
ncbi:PREDICTED: Usher syndrome type-1C protein-binding protein 1 isoform X1 [Gavialis gangeticus]|uniref:Usher syndrome type-1C protein-binding protein 1 isoform X1 n=1 Tax=Gavialis gangeticus TaxID=94835 RepID=UPI00092E67C9|nr:PREDICTED: Usher syndrome type-1C protein-binding protein 1 isoform X1 [Gavialis gangeticus]